MADKRRLIDANVFVRDLTAMKSVYDAIALDGMIKALNEAPTVDAVEVVRCKDCKYWNEDALACATLPWVNSSEHKNWYAEDFCSDGERKEGEDNAAD